MPKKPSDLMFINTNQGIEINRILKMALKTKLNKRFLFFITENKSKGIKVKIMIIGPLVNIPRVIKSKKIQISNLLILFNFNGFIKN